MDWSFLRQRFESYIKESKMLVRGGNEKDGLPMTTYCPSDICVFMVNIDSVLCGK